MSTDLIRPRLALVLASAEGEAPPPEALSRALSGGDVATVFLAPSGRDAAAFQAYAEAIVPLAQEAGAAAIVADDTRCAGRVKADGVHVSGGSLEDLQEAIGRFSPKLIVGGSGFRTRHDALEAGEMMPDYLFFGRLTGAPDTAPSAKDVELAAWWAGIVEVPCVLMAGSDLTTLNAAAQTGAEFVALSSAVFGVPGEEAAAVARANEILDEVHAQRAVE
ncbi:thiamine phosphate synthase [Aureimonas mangrovi]|uniref:thiamine phosphate synthase n=1 Tax=Aureimonas mangrovi TaxID=2758041 RepID=UPI00163D795D|nr:thiamine phosphate synthase [Aureimonas mangrovi]